MFKFLARSSFFIGRFFTAVQNFGLINALLIVFKIYALKNDVINRTKIKFLKRDFYFRTTDRVVIQFFIEGLELHSSKRNLNIVDLGANIGTQTLRFKYFFPDSRIIAVEANKGNFEILTRNTQGLGCVLYNNPVFNKKAVLQELAGDCNQSYSYQEFKEDPDKKRNDELYLPQSIGQLNNILSFEKRRCVFHKLMVPNWPLQKAKI